MSWFAVAMGACVSGALLSGQARWSMYAGKCAYVFVRAGLEPPPGQHLCTVHPAGVNATSDGAEIWFDGRGYGFRGADQSQPHLWVVTMAMQFTTTDPRYQWLNSALGVTVSEFDERAGRALWRAFVPPVEGSDRPRGRSDEGREVV